MLILTPPLLLLPLPLDDETSEGAEDKQAGVHTYQMGSSEGAGPPSRTGVVKKLCGKRYGFITPDGASEDIFMHVNVVGEAFGALEVGDAVDFRWQEVDGKKQVASLARRCSSAPASSGEEATAVLECSEQGDAQQKQDSDNQGEFEEEVDAAGGGEELFFGTQPVPNFHQCEEGDVIKGLLMQSLNVSGVQTDGFEEVLGALAEVSRQDGTAGMLTEACRALLGA